MFLSLLSQGRSASVQLLAGTSGRLPTLDVFCLWSQQAGEVEGLIIFTTETLESVELNTALLLPSPPYKLPPFPAPSLWMNLERMNLKSVLNSYKTFMVCGPFLEEWGISLPACSWSKQDASAYSLTRGQCLRERCCPCLAPAGVRGRLAAALRNQLWWLPWGQSSLPPSPWFTK